VTGKHSPSGKVSSANMLGEVGLNYTDCTSTTIVDGLDTQQWRRERHRNASTSLRASTTNQLSIPLILLVGAIKPGPRPNIGGPITIQSNISL